MKLLSYLLFLASAYPLSLLPFKALYRISDALFVVIYRWVGYRKSVVKNNISNAFPEKDAQEQIAIEQAFYRHFCDLLVENIKLLSMSKAEIQRRCTFENPELLHSYYQQGKSLTAAVAHYNNWELGGLSLALNSPHKVLAIYKPLSNKWFDNFMQRFRKGFGSHLVAMNKAARTILQHSQQPTITVFITDQTPLHVKRAHWMTFLNQDTPVFKGLERIAKKTGDPVIFCHMKRQQRGYYSVEFVEVENDPSHAPEGQITEAHTTLLEKIIRENPAPWLWSHRRWKRSRPQAETSN